MKDLVMWTCFDCDRGFFLLEDETVKHCYFCRSELIEPTQWANKVARKAEEAEV